MIFNVFQKDGVSLVITPRYVLISYLSQKNKATFTKTAQFLQQLRVDFAKTPTKSNKCTRTQKTKSFHDNLKKIASEIKKPSLKKEYAIEISRGFQNFLRRANSAANPRKICSKNIPSHGIIEMKYLITTSSGSSQKETGRSMDERFSGLTMLVQSRGGGGAGWRRVEKGEENAEGEAVNPWRGGALRAAKRRRPEEKTETARVSKNLARFLGNKLNLLVCVLISHVLIEKHYGNSRGVGQGGEALTKKSSFFLFHPYTVMAENPSSFLRKRTATLPFSPLLGDGREPSSFLRQRTATIFLLRQRTATIFLLPAENRNNLPSPGKEPQLPFSPHPGEGREPRQALTGDDRQIVLDDQVNFESSRCISSGRPGLRTDDREVVRDNQDDRQIILDDHDDHEVIQDDQVLYLLQKEANGVGFSACFKRKQKESRFSTLPRLVEGVL
ncbi:hypothetical protein M5K25_008332 [Dendrobium thyrsiflorum]|uniref:Uncharacterized protein n=1 Tax=Dendrobium thyrsiflorum TaxID=117978 RepID=A0ABD0V7R1_DENTH